MLISYKHDQDSVILRVKILDSSVTTGAGKTGLTNSSSGLIISTIADNEATATAYTQASSDIETITTLGTYAAPTTGKCRFKEVDSTNHKGIYEIQIADARFAVSSAKSLLVSIAGATGAAECDALIPLTSVDPYDGTRGGLTALPNANADAAGGLPISDAGGLDMDQIATDTAAILVDTGTTLDGAITTIDTVVDAIKVVTDALPDSGALTSIATASALATVDSNVDAILVDTGTTLDGKIDTIDTVVDAIKVVTDALPDSGALTSLATAAALTTVDTVVDGIQSDLDNGTDGLGALKALIEAIPTDPGGIKKNKALNNFAFMMVDETDLVTAETGLSVTAERSLDGAAFGACANAVSEISDGMYKINLAAGDLNGDVVILKFTATGAKTQLITITTEPGT